MAHFSAISAMDVDFINNYDNAREKPSFSSKVLSRSSSIMLNASSISYHIRMTYNNDAPDEEVREPINSSQLLYKDIG